MLALTLWFPVLMGVPIAGADAGAPAAVLASRIERYVAAVREELGTLGVRLSAVQAKARSLEVDYENNGVEREAFILATVLVLVRPLASGCENILVSGFRKGKRLFAFLVPGDAAEQAYAADLSEDEKSRAGEILGRCLARAGVESAEQLASDTAEGIARPTGLAEKEPAVKETPPRPETKTGDSSAIARKATGPTSGGETRRPGEPERVTAEQAVAPEPPTMPEAAGTAFAARPARALSAEQETELARGLGQALADAGLENISVGANAEGLWVISFENRTYRSDMDALRTALQTLSERLPVGQAILCVTRDGVPVCTVRVDLADYARLSGGVLDGAEMARRWEVKPGLTIGAEPVRVLWRRGSSHGKVDLSYRPLVRYEIGTDADPFESDLWALWRAQSTLGTGWRADVVAASRATSGRSSVLSAGVLTHTRWLGRRVLGTASIGKFRPNLYGLYAEAQLDMGPDRLGLVGVSVGEEWFSGNATQAYGYYEHEFGGLGLVVRGGYGRFLETMRTGGSLSLRRRFGESVLEAEVVRAAGGEEGINFYLSVPFGPSRVGTPEPVRLRPAPYFRANYWSTPAAQGDYLRGDHDLATFRGELTAPYVRWHADRLAGTMPRSAHSWPVAPSLEGTSGLLRIPTADVAPEGSVTVGVGFIDRAHSKAGEKTSVTPLYAAIGFLPGLEIVWRLSILHDVEPPFPDWPYGMDRSFHLHYRLSKQSRWMPAIAIGAQDVQYGTRSTYIGKATYVVGTWEEGRWRFHLGAATGRLADVFGGLEYDVLGHRVHLMAEYDGAYTNAGARAFLGDWGSLDIGALGMSRLCGSLVVRKMLR